MHITEFANALNDLVWGKWMITLLVGTGIYLTVRLRFRPITRLPYAIRQAFGRGAGGKGDISPFQSLMTTLAATIGTGNIVGVATAITMGGLGAMFWMWVSALFSMATKYAESLLAVEYRVKNSRSEYSGGPMYVMKNGLRSKRLGGLLAATFSVFTIIASFGSGNIAQANSMADAMYQSFGVNQQLTGIVTAVLAAAVMLGGIKSIGSVSEKLVPVMAAVYLGGACAVIAVNAGSLLPALQRIMSEAFSFRAAAGGVGGFAVAMRYGVARGLFSNEAGMGSAPIAAAAAQTDHPARQGYVNMTGTFFVTMVVCTFTGLAIACSGVLDSGVQYTGAALTIAAFSTVLGKLGGYIVTLSLILFAFSSIIGWSYYGEKCLEYLSGSAALCKAYRLLFAATSAYGASANITAVWSFADAANGLMALPNLVCILLMAGVVVRKTNDFDRKEIKRGKARLSNAKA